MVAVVTHCKILVRRNDDLAVMNVRKNLIGPLRLHVGLQEWRVAGWEVISKRIIGRGRIAGNVRFIEPLSVHVHQLIHNLDAVSGSSNDALDVMGMVLIRKLENDDAAPANFPVRQDAVVPMTAYSEDEFVHKEMIANEKRGLHRLGRNLEGLDNKGRAKQRQDDRDQERLYVFVQRRGTDYFPIPRGSLHLRDLGGLIHFAVPLHRLRRPIGGARPRPPPARLPSWSCLYPRR